jgi:hypothetical protein
MSAVLAHRPIPLQRLACWLALVAILWTSVLPARALPANWSATLLGPDICSVSTRQGQDADKQDPGTPTTHAAGQHCSACWVGHATGLPPAPVVVLNLPMGNTAQAPALFYSAPRRLYAWVSAPSRAPPSLA